MSGPQGNPSEEKQPILYLDWYLDQYDIGLPSSSAIETSIGYLEGLMAASPQQFARCQTIVEQLRSLEVMARTLRQYQVRMPHG